MKKLILIFSILLSSLFVNGQTLLDFPTDQGYSWQQIGRSCSGCSSFFVGVVRSEFPNNLGSYKYSIYYQTNSFDPYGSSRITYISGIKYYFWEGSWTMGQGSQEGYWILVDRNPILGYSFHSPNPRLQIKISIANYVYR